MAEAVTSVLQFRLGQVTSSAICTHPAPLPSWIVISCFPLGEDPLVDDQNERDINSVAGVLKLYFRGLENPLFPKERFQDLISTISKYFPGGMINFLTNLYWSCTPGSSLQGRGALKEAIWLLSSWNLKPSCGNNKMVYNRRTHGHGTPLGIGGAQKRRGRGSLGFSDHSWGRMMWVESLGRSGLRDPRKGWGHTDQWDQQEGVPASTWCKMLEGSDGARKGRPWMPCKDSRAFPLGLQGVMEGLGVRSAIWQTGKWWK